MLELINLAEGEETPTPFQPKRADRPTTLKLHGKMVTTSEKLPAFSFPPLQDHIKTLPAAAPEICSEEVPEEHIIYIDDDVGPAPLQLLKSQVHSLLMLPPSDTTPMAQKAPQSPGRDQLSRMSDRGKCSPGCTRKKTLQERRNCEIPKIKHQPSGKNAYWTGGHPSHPGAGQADQCSSPSSEAQDTGQLPPRRSEE